MNEKCCKDCIHYQMCVDKFRKAKTDGFYLLIDEGEYFAHAGECDFYADSSVYRRRIEGEWIPKKDMVRTPSARNYYCSECGHEPLETRHYCPECGAQMKSKN